VTRFFAKKRVSPCAVVGTGRGGERPNVNEFFPHGVDHKIVAIYFSAGARILIHRRLDTFADWRLIITGDDAAEMAVLGPSSRRSSTGITMKSWIGSAERLADLLHRLGKRNNLPHAVVAVASGDGSFRWAGAIGTADTSGTPVRHDTPYFLASIDKLYNATIVLRLHERGQVRLDESITTYLPGTLVRGLHRLDGTDHTHEISVRHLLSHTSGLADWLEDSPKGARRLTRKSDLRATRNIRAHAVVDSVRIPVGPGNAPFTAVADRIRSRPDAFSRAAHDRAFRSRAAAHRAHRVNWFLAVSLSTA
jgi:hypothetical protein